MIGLIGSFVASVEGKPSSGIRSMYVYSSACVRIKGDESGKFRIDSGVRQGCIMSPLLFNVYMDGVIKEVKTGMGRRRFEIPGGCLASCTQMTWFYVVNWRRT